MTHIPKEQWHNSFRGYFAASLYNEMCDNENIILVTADLGFGMFDRIRDDFPDRYINCGASEQAMIQIAVGLALEGKKVFAYSITTFLLRRPYESIKLYIDHEKIPVRLIGGGRDKDYSHDGYSHDASDANSILDTMPSINRHFSDSQDMVPLFVKMLVKTNTPSFLSLRR